MKPLVATVAVLVALATGAQALTPELDELRARAEQGDADAQADLGFRYSQGCGVREDDVEAVRWYRLAADQGHAGAMNSLGYLYGAPDVFAGGERVPQDYAEAVRWYRLAAEQGGADGMFSLGVMYLDGTGVPQDDVQAHMWFNLMASRTTDSERGNAVRNLDRVECRMTPDQLAEALRLASEWDAAHPRAPHCTPGPPAIGSVSVHGDRCELRVRLYRWIHLALYV